MDSSPQILDFLLAAVQAVNSGRSPIAQPEHLVDAAASPLAGAIDNLHDHSLHRMASLPQIFGQLSEVPVIHPQLMRQNAPRRVQ
jgi:hypothetical protein